MKKLITLIAVLIGLQSVAQNIPPQAINFQGVAIDKNGIPVPGMDELGNPIQNSAIRVRFSILTGTATGNISYQEEHLTNTDEFGRFNLEIGRGTATNGVFSAINWGGDKHFLQVEVDLSALGTNYTLASVQEFLSVPYALYAKTSGSSNGNDNDPDPTNEIQNLNINGNQLSISSGNSVQLPVSTDSQTLSLNGNALSIANGNTIQLPVSVDNDTTNEFQTLSIIGDTLKISNGNSILLGSNYSSSKIGVQSPNDLCFYGGEFIDFASLSSIYNTTSIVWVGSKYILANCYNYGQTQPPTLMRINRNNGSFNPVGTNIPSNINLLGCTDSMAFFIGNNSLFWLNFNQNSIANTSSNNFSNLTGNILSDPKTNMIYVEYSNGWYKYNYSNNSYVPLTLPSGTKTFIGADSLLIGSNLYNMTNSAIIANLNLSNYTESPVRIGKTLVYESSSNSGGFAKLRCHHLNTGLNEDLTNNYGYWVYMSSSFFVDPVQFSRNVIDRKILLEYNGNPFQRINNHVISTGSVTSVGIYSGSPYLASAKEIIQTDLSGRIGTFLYGSFSNYGYGISRHGDYTVVQLNEPFGCHDGLIKKTTGIIIYDAR